MSSSSSAFSRPTTLRGLNDALLLPVADVADSGGLILTTSSGTGVSSTASADSGEDDDDDDDDDDDTDTTGDADTGAFRGASCSSRGGSGALHFFPLLVAGFAASSRSAALCAISHSRPVKRPTLTSLRRGSRAASSSRRPHVISNFPTLGAGSTILAAAASVESSMLACSKNSSAAGVSRRGRCESLSSSSSALSLPKAICGVEGTIIVAFSTDIKS